MASFNKGFDLGRVARLVGEAQTPHPSDRNGVSFEAFAIGQLQTVLESCVMFNSSVAPRDQRGLIWGGLVQLAKGGVFDGAALQAAIKTAESDYLAKPVRDYVVLTSINFHGGPRVFTRRFEGAWLTFSSNLPRRFDRRTLESRIRHLTSEEWPHNFTSVRIRLRERTFQSAADAGLRALDFFRAMWNYRLNRRTLSRTSLGQLREPVNEIRLGPIHTLHNVDGTAACETFWFDSSLPSVPKPFDMKPHFADFRKTELVLRGQLTKSPYGPDLTKLLLKYNDALDERSYEVAFNKLFAVLEHLTGTVGSSYGTFGAVPVRWTVYRFRNKRVSFPCAARRAPSGAAPRSSVWKTRSAAQISR